MVEGRGVVDEEMRGEGYLENAHQLPGGSVLSLREGPMCFGHILRLVCCGRKHLRREQKVS